MLWVRLFLANEICSGKDIGIVLVWFARSTLEDVVGLEFRSRAALADFHVSASESHMHIRTASRGLVGSS
jgi:hypothetical protein